MSTTAPSALSLMLRLKRLAMLRDPEALVDTLLVSLESQRLLIKRVRALERKVKALEGNR